MAALNKTVTISVDGVAQEVSTLSGSVDGALDAAGLTVAEHDTLAPAADAEITDGSQIVLERGRLLTLTIDGADPRGLDDGHDGRGGAGRTGPGSGGVQAVRQPFQVDPVGRAGGHRGHPAHGHRDQSTVRPTEYTAAGQDRR